MPFDTTANFADARRGLIASLPEPVIIRNAQGVPKAWISKRVGGDQLDYIDEKPEIRRLFATELAKHGMASRMDPAYAKEMAELGVKTA